MPRNYFSQWNHPQEIKIVAVNSPWRGHLSGVWRLNQEDSEGALLDLSQEEIQSLFPFCVHPDWPQEEGCIDLEATNEFV